MPLEGLPANFALNSSCAEAFPSSPPPPAIIRSEPPRRLNPPSKSEAAAAAAIRGKGGSYLAASAMPDRGRNPKGGTRKKSPAWDLGRPEPRPILNLGSPRHSRSTPSRKTVASAQRRGGRRKSGRRRRGSWAGGAYHVVAGAHEAGRSPERRAWVAGSVAAEGGQPAATAARARAGGDVWLGFRRGGSTCYLFGLGAVSTMRL
jgi:hypothetical protein